MKTNKIFKGIEWKSIEIGVINNPNHFLIQTTITKLSLKKSLI